MSKLSETILVQIESVTAVREPDGAMERMRVSVMPVGVRVPEVPAYALHTPSSPAMTFEVPEALSAHLRPGRYLAVDLRTCTAAENEKAARVATDVRTAYHRELAEQRAQQDAMSGMVRGIARTYGLAPPSPGPLTIVDDTRTDAAPRPVTPLHPILRSDT